MKVGYARNAAMEWVLQHGSKAEGFMGAYFAGSAAEMHADAKLPEFSDIDIMVIVLSDEAPLKLGKFVYGSVMLEVTYMAWKQLSSAKKVLESHHPANTLAAA